MSDQTISNRLLATLPPKDLKRILSVSEPLELNYAETLFRSGQEIEYVYFPESGLISLLSLVGKESSLEVGVVGNEGMVGLPIFLGSSISRNTGIVQGPGRALRVPAADFLKECDRSKAMSLALRRFAHSLMSQISQSAVCFRYHKVEKRLARWLLMVADRMAAETFVLTQEFLAHMLGVRREAVAISAGEMQRRGLIKYSRGKIEILNRKQLERGACVCYAIIKNDELLS